MKCYIHANERKTISKNKFRHKIFASCRKFTQIYRTFSKMSVNSDAIMSYVRIFSVSLWTIPSVKSTNITHPAVKLLWKSSHHWLTGNLGYLANCYVRLILGKWKICQFLLTMLLLWLKKDQWLLSTKWPKTDQTSYKPVQMSMTDQFWLWQIKFCSMWLWLWLILIM